MPILVKNNTGGTLGTQILDAESGVDLGHALMVVSLSIDFGGAESVVRGKFVLGIVHTETKCRKAQWMISDPVSGGLQELEEVRFKNGNVIKFYENGMMDFFEKGDLVQLQAVSDGRIQKFRAVPTTRSNEPKSEPDSSISPDKEI